MSVRLIGVLCILCASTSSLSAGDVPDLKDLIKQVDERTKALTSVSYSAEFHAEGDEALVERVGQVRGRVIAREGKRSLIGDVIGRGGNLLVRYEGEVKLPGTEDWIPFEIASDGRAVYRIDPAAKTFTKGELPGAQPLMRRGISLLMQEYVHPTPFTDEMNALKTEYEGEKEIGGVVCHVVFVHYSQNDIQARWYFGKEDYLPRRVDRINRGDEKGATVLTVTDLKTDPEIDSETFKLEPPDGYDVKEFSAVEEEKAGQLLGIGSPAPQFSLKSADGETVELSSLKGQVVVLDFWATWCGPCKLAMPGVQRLHEKYIGKPVKVFGVSTWERANGKPAQYMGDKKFTYGLLLEGDDVADAYKLGGLPTFYVIDTAGKIIYASAGFLPEKEQEISKVIDRAVAAASK